MLIMETRRLLLQHAHVNDSAYFFRQLNSAGWLAYIGDRGIRTPDDAGNYIQNSILKSYEAYGFGLYKMVLKREKRPVGLCGLVKRPELDHPDIGFALLPEYEGYGYAFEAAQATMRYARLQLGLDSILAITKANNAKSKKLLQKIGLKQTGTLALGDEELLLYSG